MTKSVTMDSNARVRRRSRKRYESCDHNFDTLIQNKYEERKTALDQNYVSILRETRNLQKRNGESNNFEDNPNPKPCPLDTPSSSSSEATPVKESGYRRGSLGSALSSRKKSHTEGDRNFDRLSQSFGSGSNIMELKYSQGSKLDKQSDKNNYWKQYEAKYGRLGISIGDNSSDILDSVTSGSKCSSPRESKISSSLSYSCNGVIGRHSFKKTDSDEVDTSTTNSLSTVHGAKLKRKERNRSKRNSEPSDPGLLISSGAEYSDDDNSSEHLSSKPPRGQSVRRRTTSDLGFTETNCSTPRTSALLRQPSFRKHLAKIMHVKDQGGEKQDSLTLELAFKLASTSNLLKLKNNSEEELNKLEHDCQHAEGDKLRMSQSEHNLRCKVGRNVAKKLRYI